MTKTECAQLIYMLKEYYPRDIENSTIAKRVNAWYLILQDKDYNEAVAAVLAFVSTDTKGFMPSVGQINEKLTKMWSDDDMTEMEAWGLVRRAASNSGYHAVEEFERLPPKIRRLVGSPSQLKEWGMMNIDEFNTVVQSNFMRSYRARTEKDSERLALPSVVQLLLDRGDMDTEMSKTLTLAAGIGSGEE